MFRVLLTLALALSVFTGEAFAQCTGKTVYLEAPNGWGDNGKIYYIADNIGSVTNISHEGRWLVIKFPSNFNGSNDRADVKFAFLFDSAFADHPGTKWIYANGYDEMRTQRVQTGTGGFSCNNSAFGADGRVYIYPDPNNPTKTLTSTTIPNIYYFYFLPPDDPDWILSTPYLVIGTAKKAMSYDEKRCGWYKVSYFPEEPPNGDAVIWPGPADSPIYQIGLLGMDEDPMDWPGSGPTPFKLKEQFDKFDAKEIYFAAQNGVNGWTAIDPIIEEKARCNYSFAAIIYQRTLTTNTNGFSWYEGPGDPSFGICKGLAKDTLVNGKMQWNSDCSVPRSGAPGVAGDGNYNSGWGNGENFTNAFKETPGQNTVKCYDMPFQKRPGGLWEFDAFYLCKDGTTTDYSSTYTTGCGTAAGGAGSIGGFYNMKSNDGTALGVRKNYEGNRIGIWEAYKWCFDRGWSGKIGSRGIGDLSNKTTKAELDAEMQRVCSDSLRANNVPQLYTTGINDAVPAHDPGWMSNQVPTVASGGHLCFESQDAEFIYEKGQEFFFRGDDDIWVFINNQLVIDLGGNHMPAPGYVKLDTITKPAKLEVGKKYPIKIFFCDRRGPGSNVRISTNMYFSQKSGLSLASETVQKLGDVCLEQSGGGSCAAVASGTTASTEKCGPELRNQLQYYIQKWNGDGKQYLVDANSPGCSQEGNLLKCYGSITIDFSGGQVQVLPIAQGLVGTWVVYAEVKEGVIEPKPAPLRLGTTAGRSSIQVAWGTIKSESNGQIITTLSDYTNGVGGKVGKRAVASKLIPVAFAEGGWATDSSSAGAIFEVLETSKGSTVRIQETSKRDPNVTGSYLLAYRDPEGTQEVDLSRDQTIPDNGVLVLYFTGEFEAEGTAIYNINSRTENLGASFALEVHQPKIEFVDASNEIIPQNQRIGSDPAKGNNATERWVYVGTTLNRRIAAFDPVDGGICTTCTFKPADITTDPYISRRGGASEKNKEAILFPERKLENGIGNLSLYSTIRIQFENDSSAYFTVRGPSEEQSKIARWDSLQFREPPVPYPVNAEIFDRNGDGRGDSIRIIYNRGFPEDTLPNMLQVVWSLSDTVSFGKAQRGSDGRYTDAGIAPDENKAFWAPYLRRGANQKDGDTIIITVPYGDRENVQPQFNKDIKTAVHGIGEAVISWSTYTDDEGNSGITSSFTTGIKDRMPPIVISAEYQGGEGDCGTDASRPCIDYVRVWLSEPVKSAEGANDEKSKEAFAYKLLIRGEDANFEVYRESKSLPTEMLWSKNDRWLPKEDSIVRLTYRRFKTENDNSYTPVPGDSIRLLAFGGNLQDHAFKDLAGNSPNPEEWGRKIEGRGPWSVDKNLIANLDPTKTDSLKNNIRKRFGNVIANRFTPDKPIQLLPVPEGWKGDNLKDSLGYNYPSSVGPIFWPGARATIDELDTKLGTKIPRNKIWFVANSFYHTNLGGYTAKSGELRIHCEDPVFQVNGAKDCTESENGLYLAWDLKDNKGRWVGTGAYVQVYNFHWEVSGVSPIVNGIVKKYPDDGNKIEMYGVRRVK